MLKQRRFGDQIRHTAGQGVCAAQWWTHISRKRDEMDTSAGLARADQRAGQQRQERLPVVHYVTHVVRVQDSKDRQRDRTIGELVAQVANQDRRGDIYIEDAVGRWAATGCAYRIA